MKTLWIGLGVLGCALPFGLAACGSAPDSSAFGGPGGATDSGTGSDGTSGDTGPGSDTSFDKDTAGGHDTTPPPDDTTTPPPDAPPPVTLDNVCDRLADVVCTTATQACCSSKGISYDESGCRAGVAAWCGAEVDAVKAGSMTFDGTFFGTCATVWSSFESKCSVPILDFVRSDTACELLFNGNGAPGDPCSASTDCHSDGLGFADCSQSSGTCDEFIIVDKDAPCNYTGPVIHFCDYGLYCSTTTGTCRTAKTPGTGCSGPSDLSCGFGNTCSGGHCAPGAPEGTPCFSDLDCASWNCGTTGACTDPNFELATSATCNGSP